MPATQLCRTRGRVLAKRECFANSSRPTTPHKHGVFLHARAATTTHAGRRLPDRPPHFTRTPAGYPRKLRRKKTNICSDFEHRAKMQYIFSRKPLTTARECATMAAHGVNCIRRTHAESVSSISKCAVLPHGPRFYIARACAPRKSAGVHLHQSKKRR